MRFLTAGESHGKALVGILEGLPSGIHIHREFIQAELLRRKKGFGRGDRQKIETDEVEIVSGVRHGKTLGSPISLIIHNKDWENWSLTMSVEPACTDREVLVPRPGHADYVGSLKYNFEDMRNVLERSSARETTIRVAIAAICKEFLKQLDIYIYSRVTSIGSVKDTTPEFNFSEENLSVIENSQVRCLDLNATRLMIEEIVAAQNAGDTLGGTFETVASNVPVGLGSYVQWDRRLEGDLAKSIMSLNAIKGVEVGLGFGSANIYGSQVHDELQIENGKIFYKTNKSGGITGGMSTGQDIVLRAAMKPLSTLKKSLNSVNLNLKEAQPAHFERSDVCAVPSAAVISEGLIALVLTEHILNMFGGDSLDVIQARVKEWRTKTSGEL